MLFWATFGFGSAIEWLGACRVESIGGVGVVDLLAAEVGVGSRYGDLDKQVEVHGGHGGLE